MKKLYFNLGIQSIFITVLVFLVLQTAQAQSDFTVTPCSTYEEALAIIDTVLLGNVADDFKKNIVITGDLNSIGYYINGELFGFSESTGIALSTGFVSTLSNSNNCLNSTSGFTSGGTDADLSLMSGQSIHDAIIVEFDVMLFYDSLYLSYSFGSEEYHEWVGTMWNDRFGFFVSGPGINGDYSNNAINVAKVPGTSDDVSINTINCGNMPKGCGTPPGNGANCDFLYNNLDNTQPYFNQCSLNAFTIGLKTRQAIQSYEWYHIKLAIGDASDAYYDSGVLLEKGSIVSIPIPEMLVFETDSIPEVITLVDSLFLGETIDENKANISFSGDPKAFGYVAEANFLNLEAGSGIYLGTGNAGDISKANKCSMSSSINTDNNGLEYDPDLAILAENIDLEDISVLEFDYLSTDDTIRFNYVFASEEYHEMVDYSYHDVFGIFLSGKDIEGEFTNSAVNIATIGNSLLPVNSSTINFGPGGITCQEKPEDCLNCEFLIDNSQKPDTAFFGFAFDAYTVPINAVYPVMKGEWYHIKVAIGDAQNANFDSGIFLSDGTLVSDSLITSVKNFSAPNPIRVKPNPANDYLEIQNFGKSSILNYSIFDLNGKLLINSDFTQEKISLSGLPKGLLIIEVITEKDSFRQKFIHN
jgi:hypothetical protein